MQSHPEYLCVHSRKGKRIIGLRTASSASCDFPHAADAFSVRRELLVDQLTHVRPPWLSALVTWFIIASGPDTFGPWGMTSRQKGCVDSTGTRETGGKAASEPGFRTAGLHSVSSEGILLLRTNRLTNGVTGLPKILIARTNTEEEWKPGSQLGFSQEQGA